ncbi:MAG: MBL fold metallo-hydrolase [Campylobacterota bacterium]|nr:MBL fold metallo-hydrolase [Campylobacterota bacterium]
MFKVELIQAGHGDSIWIEYGRDPDSLHRILIDGGTAGTFKRLKKRIEQLPSDKRHFDLLVITHIDADHIAGVLKLLEEDSLGVTFGDIWYNGYQHLSSLESLGVKQAEILSDYLDKLDIHWNQAFGGKSACIDREKEFLPIVLPGGMKLTLLSPSLKELAKLKPKWEREAEKAGLFLNKKPEEREELDTSPSGLESLGGAKLPDIESLAKSIFEPDDSLPNGSSIALITEYDDKKMLFAGDAHAAVLLDSIKAYLPGCQPLYLDLFKVPHHGSEANISKALLERIRCNSYLISSNGAYFKHPDEIAIARIIKYGGNKPDIYFNYLSKHNDIWNNPILQKRYQYQAHYPSSEETSIVVSV